MYSYVNQYFRLVQSIYKIVYGNNYSMPVVFAENLDDFLPLVQYINISQAPLNTCNNMELAKAIENFMFTYFQNFVDSSYRQFINCTRSASVLTCANILGSQLNNFPALIDLLESKTQPIEHSTFDLMVTTNATLNPVAFVQRYHVEKNLLEFEDYLNRLAAASNSLNQALTLAMVDSTEEQRTCLQEINDNLITFREHPFIGQTNEVITKIAQFVEDNSFLSLYNGFAVQNTAIVRIKFVPYTIQRVIYPADYNFWSFLAEFGGVLGLYFGATMVTLYETIFFLLSEPAQDSSNHMPEKMFTKKVLYEQENSHDETLVIPH